MRRTTLGSSDEQLFGLGTNAAISRMVRTVPVLLFGSLWLGTCIGGLFVAGHHHSHQPGVQWDVVAPLAIAVLLALGALSAASWAFCLMQARSYKIELRSEGVVLDYGVINQRHEVLLFSKIQDILITRSVLERLLGLSTLIVQNAMGTPVVVPGLDTSTAETLRDRLLSRATN